MDSASTPIGRLNRYSTPFWPYLQLIRPANVVTAMADILAGYAVAGQPNLTALIWLLAATVGLYSGGIVFNDFFDAKLDAVERPERPIPRGTVSIERAALLGGALLAVGVAAAFQAGPASGFLASAIALSALLYDAWGKSEPILGTAGIGLCRGLNLLLGMSAAPAFLSHYGLLALIAFFYITAVTVLSKGEVEGGHSGRGPAALFLLVLSMGIFFLPAAKPPLGIGAFLPFWFLLLIRVVPPFWRAARNPEPAVIRAAVKSGILSLIILDAALAAGHAGLLYGVALLSLSLLAGPLARLFAVT
jgi:4-hydroxybenzoate polyprenyltransferase